MSGKFIRNLKGAKEGVVNEKVKIVIVSEMIVFLMAILCVFLKITLLIGIECILIVDVDDK